MASRWKDAGQFVIWFTDVCHKLCTWVLTGARSLSEMEPIFDVFQAVIDKRPVRVIVGRPGEVIPASSAAPESGSFLRQGTDAKLPRGEASLTKPEIKRDFPEVNVSEAFLYHVADAIGVTNLTSLEVRHYTLCADASEMDVREELSSVGSYIFRDRLGLAGYLLTAALRQPGGRKGVLGTPGHDRKRNVMFVEGREGVGVLTAQWCNQRWYLDFESNGYKGNPGDQVFMPR